MKNIFIALAFMAVLAGPARADQVYTDAKGNVNLSTVTMQDICVNDATATRCNTLVGGVGHNGRVGIKTLSPQTELDVNGTITATTLAVGAVTQTSACVGPSCTLPTDGTVLVSSGPLIAQSSSTNAAAVVQSWRSAAGTVLGVWQQDGKLGVGTSAPGEKLQVVGGDFAIDVNQKAQFDGATGNIFAAGASGLTQNGLQLQGDGNGPGFLTGNLGVGIGAYAAGGSAIPTNGLIVSGSVGISTTNPGALPGNTLSGTIFQLGSSALSIGRMVVEANAPSYDLWDNNAPANDRHWRFNVIDGTATFNQLPDDGSTGVIPLALSPGGSVGIGTASPVSTMTVNGPLMVTSPGTENAQFYLSGDATHAAAAKIEYEESSANLKFTPRSGFNSYFSAGNLGIGTASPIATLHNAGDTSLVGPVTAGSSVTVTGIGSSSFMGFASKTKAQLEAITPTAVGQAYYCSNCSNSVNVVISTGTGIDDFDSFGIGGTVWH